MAIVVIAVRNYQRWMYPPLSYHPHHIPSSQPHLPPVVSFGRIMEGGGGIGVGKEPKADEDDSCGFRIVSSKDEWYGDEGGYDRMVRRSVTIIRMDGSL